MRSSDAAEAASVSFSDRFSLRTTLARIDHDVSFNVARFLALAELALVGAADKRAADQDVVAGVQAFCECGAIIPQYDAVPVSLRLPLVLRVLPRALRGD